MYIKQIIIQGFKSYKEQTVIEPFSPKHNVIVGRNGSGKSNFFAAIRFVLGDAYTQMGRGERQALLHEGTGSAVMSAFVEIIFDNSDERFPTGKNEVVLRRTIGMKKDEYSLDKKSATKLDVMNLLESAGFSRSNPYYIVPQGRVTALTNMKDSERLSLLKEVAGTQVYESRRTESLKIMTEVDNKREKIDDILKYIQERLAELEEEMEELREFQEKDKDRRCLQYTIDHREQEAIANELENLQEQRQTGVDGTDDNQERIIQGERELAAITAEISGLNQQVEFLKVDKKQFDEERREKARARAKLELDVKTLSDGLSAAQQAMANYDSELRSLEDSIKEHEDELAEITPQYESKVQEEGLIKSELDGAEGTRQRLYTKQGRNARFRNKKERDDWLRAEINNSSSQLAGVQAARKQTTEDIAELEEDIASADAEINRLRAQLDDRGATNDVMQREIQEAKATRDALIDERKELWRADAKLDSVLSNARNELRRAEQELSHMMDHNTSRGLASVQRIKMQDKLEGLYGTLAELVNVDERYQRAVESTAGASLFHYVVDNDVTATRVIEILQKEKAGRITFIPLNRVKQRSGNVPAASDSIPMLEKLEFDPVYERAFQQVFGQTIICPNLTVAGQYARSHGVNGVTLDGDRSDRKGAFTGGFIDSRQSRLQAVRKVNKWREEYEELMARSLEIKRTLERKDQEITRAVGELQKIEQKRLQQENSYGPLRQELRGKSGSLQVKQDTLIAEQRAKASIEANIKSLLDQQNAHKAEIGSDFKNALTREEESQLKTLSSTVQDLRRRYSEISSSRGELESRKTLLENELRENCRPRLDQLKAQERDSGSQGQLKESQRELKKIEKAIAAVVKKLLGCETAIEQATTSIAELNQRHADILRTQTDIAKSLEKQQKRLEKSVQKRRILTKQAAECANKIRDLGILPHGALDKYAKTSSDSIVKRLHKVHEALKKFTHVNKKAIEQYNNFISQRDTLIKRRADLDSSKSSIQELITVLDQRKDEAIERTFKQVSREFANVFEKLVPAGRGRLVIQRKTDRQQQGEDEEDSDDERRQSVENYTGVGISVSFNSKHDDQQRIQQLSGGQKSLCALALVFAIQKCDPAPFYLFDEIDANLDAQYRQAVADMLKSISESGGEEGGGGQFICTTFRPEMLHVAEKCYGVRYERKSSAVVVVSKAEALDFVEGERQ